MNLLIPMSLIGEAINYLPISQEDIVLLKQVYPVTYGLSINKTRKYSSVTPSNFDIITLLLKEFHILTLDLETRKLSNNKLEVISNCIYNGSTYETFYLPDFDFNQVRLLEASINYLLKSEYNGYSIYVHNLSHFDGSFIFKSIVDLKKIGYTINLLYKDDKMISIEIKRSASVSKKLGFEDESFSITFYDSYLILPTSLNKLAKSFGLETKLNFDVLSNDNADLTDIDFKYKLLEYNKYDCKLLYDIITNFRIEIINLFGVDIYKTPTLPSLAFKIYNNKFQENKLSITWLEDYKEISKGYRGGAVDVYRPSGENLYYYDANSLYPHVMKANKFPIDDFDILEGEWDLNSIFGIVYAKITAPDNLKVPILLVKNDQTNHKTIAPLGAWEGWYVSEELKFAESYGYKIQVIRAYHWDNKADIFSGYVDTLYQNRLKYEKSNPKNFISKLLMNSLYGKFGMSPILMNYELYKADDKLIDKAEENAKDIIDFGEVKLIGQEIENNSHESYKKVSFDKKSRGKSKYEQLLNISTHISMFITAYARMHMNKLKIQYKNNLYYTDTDSIVLDVELPNNIISNKLGDFKMEYKIQKGIFLAPKVYGLLLEDGSEVVKIKGSKIKMNFSDLEPLLQKDSNLKITQEKWFKNLPEQHIKILKTLYTLRVTDNKRILIYKDGIFIDTKPIIIE
jgi:DNA polymerase type B, organellar and viral